MLQKKHALLNRVEGATNEAERQHLRRVSSHRHIAATLLPIRSVGVQVFQLTIDRYRRTTNRRYNVSMRSFFSFSTTLDIETFRLTGRSKELQLRGRPVIRGNRVRGSGVGRYALSREAHPTRMSQRKSGMLHLRTTASSSDSGHHAYLSHFECDSDSATGGSLS